MSARGDTARFQQQAREIYGDKYDYSGVSYTTRDAPITIMCPKHGPFDTTAKRFIFSRNGCPKCGTESRYARTQDNITHKAAFVEKARKVHGDKYDYTMLPDRVKTFDLQEIVCPEHGTFKQKPAYHLQGNGCPECGKALKLGRYDGDFFNVNPLKKLSPATIYFVTVTKDEETFYKIGITIRQLKRRYHGKGVTITVNAQKQTNLYDAYELEQKIKRDLRKYQYYPKFKFEGRTECFLLDPAVEAHITSALNTPDTEQEHTNG